MFEDELQFFIANQDALVAQYGGKTLILQGREVVGAYATVLEAYLEAMRRFTPGTFMLQRCEPGPEAYTVTISTLGLAATA